MNANDSTSIVGERIGMAASELDDLDCIARRDRAVPLGVRNPPIFLWARIIVD